MNAVSDHLSIDVLLDYWLHDSDSATTDAVDEHLMRCDACGELLDGLIALGEGVRGVFTAGAVPAMASDAFVQHLKGQGLRVREYRVPHNGSVNCAVAPEDDLLVAHLEAPLQGVARLDALAQLSIAPDVQHRLQDIPFDPQAGEALYILKTAEMKQLPDHTAQFTLLAVHPGGTKELGRYTFHHQGVAGTAVDRAR